MKITKLRFGAFLAPHHPIGKNPTRQLEDDLALTQHLDQLGFDEFWCGEHHSTGWEVIASPEMFLAGAAQRTHNIKLGTGVISLPYHHPFNVAQRMVQLDHMSNGRAIFGSGPGALPSDAFTLGIDPAVQRDRQDEAISVIKKLLSGADRFTYECEWFTLKDAKLQLLPVQEDMPFVVASAISPSGMTLAGKYGAAPFSIASTSTAGLQSLTTQWGFAEESAAKHGQTVNRDDWRVLMNWHLAETREQAEAESKHGLLHWHNQYNVNVLKRPGTEAYKTANDAIKKMVRGDDAGVLIGTPDDMIQAIHKMVEITGGFGTVVGFVHDWCNREANFRSWELFMNEVVPAVNGMLDHFKESEQYVIDNRESFEAAGKAVLSKILEHEGAAKAMQEGKAAPRAKAAMGAHHAPDLSKKDTES